MAKKDCMNCKNCTLRPMAFENAITNVCDFEDRIHAMTGEELLRRIQTKECEWFEKGTPKRSDEPVYDD